MCLILIPTPKQLFVIEIEYNSKSQLGYTGYGWDEFYDDDAGIKEQLLDLLYQLTENTRAGNNVVSRWEDQMDNHETERKLLSERLSCTYKSFVDRMNQHFASKGEAKLKLITDDKAEKLTWGQLDIKRSGNLFQITDAGGSIPIGTTLGQWKVKFAIEQPKPQPEPEKALPSKASNKSTKRRVIEESSDEEDEELEKKPAAKQPSPIKDPLSGSSSGIEVQIRKSTNPTGNSSSVDEIKRQLGVSTKQLEEGRKHLENENRASSMAANNDELLEIVSDFGTLNQCIAQWRKLQSYKSCPTFYEEMEEVSYQLKAKLLRWKSKAEEMSRVLSKTKGLDSEESADVSEH